MTKIPHSQKKPKVIDAERHKRFVEVAKKLDIPDDADLSDDFFKKIVKRSTKFSIDKVVTSKRN